jgi:tetratricopeptide (TPR) repeat protein
VPLERDPEIPEGITAGDLDREVRAELAGLGRELAAETGAHLAAAGFFFESDPERAWAHAVAARRRAARLGVVRETAGLAAYRAGRYADALSELRTARRVNGSNVHLPVMADSERGLGRPERALDLAHSPEARTLDRNSKIELLIVESGARTDLGEHDAAVVVLQIPELDSPTNSPTLARLRFAYSEALNRAAREREAQTWRERAMDSDRDGTADLYAELDDEIIDLEDGEYEDGEDDADGDDVALGDTDAADVPGADGTSADLATDADEAADADEDDEDVDELEEDGPVVNQNDAGDVKENVIADGTESNGGAQFTDAVSTGPKSATPTGPAPLPKFESEVKDET